MRTLLTDLIVSIPLAFCSQLGRSFSFGGHLAMLGVIVGYSWRDSDDGIRVCS